MNTPAPLSPKQEKLRLIRAELTKAAPAMKAVASNVISVDKINQVAINCIAKNATLLECSAKSLLRCVANAAELGLSFGAIGHAHIVPFKNGDVYEAQLIITAQGFCDLAYRSGMVEWISIECVYEGDLFEYQLGTDPYIKHVPCGEVDPAKITHAYMVARIKTGGTPFKVMSRAEIERIRDRSPAVKFSKKKGFKTPWDTDTAEMFRKTVGKNGAKYIPKNVQLARAIAYDNAAETGDQSLVELDFDEDDVIDVQEVQGTSQAVSEKVKKAAAQLDDDDDQVEPPYTGPTVKPGESGDDSDQGRLV